GAKNARPEFQDDQDYTEIPHRRLHAATASFATRRSQPVRTSALAILPSRGWGALGDLAGDEPIDGLEIRLRQQGKANREPGTVAMTSVPQHFAGQPNRADVGEIQCEVDALADGHQRTGEEHSSQRKVCADTGDTPVRVLELRRHLTGDAKILASDGMAGPVQAIHARLELHRLISLLTWRKCFVHWL